MYAILLDGETKGALAAARELAAAGVRVVVGSEYRFAPAGYSRAVAKRFTYPSPKASQRDFVAALKAAATRLPEPPVVLVFSDATYLTLAAFADELTQVSRFVVAPEVARAIVFDKGKTAELAHSLSIPTMPELTALPTEFPVVVKPRTSVSWQSGEGVFATATMVFDQKGFERVSEAIVRTSGAPALVQRLVYGPEYGVELLSKDGAVILSYVHHRVRSLSPRGGAATVKEEWSAPQAETIKAYAIALAQSLAWTGPLMVEFKYDLETSTYRLMELNGRFWGSLPLPLAAGVPFARAYVELVTGVDLKSSALARTKVKRTQHLLGDLKWLLLVWLAHDRLRATLYPSRFKATIDFIKDTLCTHKDIESWRDPLPFVMEIVHTMTKSRL